MTCARTKGYLNPTRKQQQQQLIPRHRPSNRIPNTHRVYTPPNPPQLSINSTLQRHHAQQRPKQGWARNNTTQITSRTTHPLLSYSVTTISLGITYENNTSGWVHPSSSKRGGFFVPNARDSPSRRRWSEGHIRLRPEICGTQLATSGSLSRWITKIVVAKIRFSWFISDSVPKN